MKRMLGLDQSYEELREIGLIGTEFAGMSSSLIRKYIETLMSGRLYKDQVKQILDLLKRENKDSRSTLKMLILINIIIHETVYRDKHDFDELIAEEINLIIKLENSRYERTQKKRNKERERGFSIQKTVGWIKEGIRETFSKSKEKPERSSLSLNNSKLRSRATTEVTQNFDTPNGKVEKIDSQTEMKGKQQILIYELIIPYATYLLKLASSQINMEKQFALPNLKTQHLWKIVNLLNYLLKVSSSFNTIMRYYKSDYELIVEATVRSMDKQIKMLYPLLDKSINKKFELFKKETLEIYREETNSRAKADKIQQIVYKYEVTELKQIIQEIARLNEQIQKVYLGKYIYHKVKAMGIYQPSLITDASFDLLFDVVRELEKNKSQSKRKSMSKEKNQKTQMVSNLKQETPNLNKSTFTQKKLKIITSQDKKTVPKNPDALNQTAPIQAESQSTFRKMRMNMTSTSVAHINWEESNTRRLRL